MYGLSLSLMLTIVFYLVSTYLHLIFTILQFDISSLIQQAEKSSSNLEKIQFIKLNISNWRFAKNQVQIAQWLALVLDPPL